MAEIIEMPKLSDTMEEGGVASWLKKEGDFVEEGEALVEIETDKATMEYNSPAEGVLLKILVPAGTTCALNAPIGVIGEKGEDVEGILVKAKAAAQPVPSNDPAPTVTSSAATKGVEEAPSGPTAPSTPSGGRIIASPLAKKVAEEKGIDLGQIQGSGPGGRIIAADLEGVSVAPAARGQSPSRQDRTESVSMMRKTIAKRLLAAKNEAPHFYLTRSVDMTNALAWREKLNDKADGDAGSPKVSVNDLITMACAKALRQHEGVNASWQGDSILYHGGVHVAIAVALPTGLVTPVVRDTDQLGVREIAAAIRQLVGQARNGELGNDAYAGGTFTISNLGMFGIDEFTAIINPPQGAILAVGATKPTPVVNHKGKVVVRQVMKMTMSCDHRVIDGAVGAQFLQTLVGFLEDPVMMLA